MGPTSVGSAGEKPFSVWHRETDPADTIIRRQQATLAIHNSDFAL